VWWRLNKTTTARAEREKAEQRRGDPPFALYDSCTRAVLAALEKYPNGCYHDMVDE